MVERKADVDYQQRAKEFSVGDEAFPFMFGDEYGTGRVVNVHDAIGIVDVEYPNGTKAYPVEDLQRVRTEVQPPALSENVPGGVEGPSVSGGPPLKDSSIHRIAAAFVKKSIYWASRDRKYRATLVEIEAGSFTCPRCHEAQLRKVVYKRSEGSSVRLLGCPSCLFLIKSNDLIGHPEYEEVL